MLFMPQTIERGRPLRADVFPRPGFMFGFLEAKNQRTGQFVRSDQFRLVLPPNEGIYDGDNMAAFSYISNHMHVNPAAEGWYNTDDAATLTTRDLGPGQGPKIHILEGRITIIEFQPTEQI